MINHIKTCKYPLLRTAKLSKLCSRGQSICHFFGIEVIGDSKNLKFETGSDCYTIIDDSGVEVGKIVPRMDEDEIWYGINESRVDQSITLEARGKWWETPIIIYLHNQYMS